MGRKEEQIKIQDGKELESTVDLSRYERLQRKIFCFLETPTSKWAVSYHILNLFFILGSIVVSVLCTIDSFEDDQTFNEFTFVFEIILLAWFSAEYVLRVWSCSVLKRFRGWGGRLKFLKNFYMCVDAFIIVSTTVTSLLQVERSYFTILRATRFLQVFRILRIDRQKGDLGMMLRAVRTHRRELVTCYFVGFIILFGGAYVVYMLEHGAKEAKITDMVKGIYWGLITVTSVGYGDFSPVTWGGKFVTGIYGLVGCAFFALPAGILGSGFAIQQAKQKSQQNMIKIRNPAATLIQNLWRTYATNRNNARFKATWDNLLPLITGNVQWPGYYSCLPGINAICNSEEFDGFKVGLPHSSRKDSIMSPLASWGLSEISSPTKKLSVFSHKSGEPTTPTSPRRRFSRASFLKRSSGSTLKRPSCVNTTLQKKDNARMAKYKAAIQFIIRIKYWCCIYHFKRQRLPFVEMTDIWDKNAQSHQETINFLREMKDQATKLRTDLSFMKIAFVDTVLLKMHQDNAVHSQKKTRSTLLNGDLREDIRKNFWTKQSEDRKSRLAESKVDEKEREMTLSDDEVFLKPPPSPS